ncbi:MAG: DMT family transporter [Oscillospiraceae bacterium]|nr:DMT family transporter [Oscillospiraceae bacterium]
MNKRLKGSLTLFGAVIIWGSAFIAQSMGMELIGPFTFQAIRCGLAVLFLIPVSFLFDRKPGALKRWLDPRLWRSGLICGLALFAAASLQQVGLVYTDAGKAGFLTAMYIVLVPILGLFLGQKPGKSAWFSVGLAVVGLYLLSCMGVSQINIGDILLAGCALAYAVQITCIDRLAGDLDGVRLNCVQALVVTVLSIPFMVFTETVDIGNILACSLPLAYAGILSMGVAYSLQIVGQKYLEPTTASLIMSLESVIAALCGWLILKETMTPWELLGCGLVFAAVIISQLPKKETT